MGQYRDFQDAYQSHAVQIANDPLNRALDMLYNLSSTYYTVQADKDKEIREEEGFNRRLRLNEAERLGRLHPDIDPFQFGNVVTSENDFLSYKNEVIQKENLNTLGKQYQPTGNLGVISEEAQQDMFTYGDTRYSLDTTPGIISQDDLFNYDAWLLGEHGYGKDIAIKHQHKGILYESIEDPESPYYGKYVLDTGEYHDLKDKGLITNMLPDASGNYILDEIQRNDILKKYNYWREGFVSSRELKTKSDITNLIAGQNQIDLEFENELRKNKKYESIFNQLDNWKDILNTNKTNMLVDENGDFSTDYIVDGQPVYDTKTRKDFMEDFPKVYNMLTTNFTIESVAQQVITDPDLQTQLQDIPQLNAYVMQQLQNLNDVNIERRKQGISVDKYQHLNDSRIMGEARDIVLNDLNSGALGYGSLFDLSKFSQLNEAQQDTLVNDLMNLEASYSDRNSVNYNPSVLTFLSLYGLGDEGIEPGMALESFMEELRQRKSGQ